MSRSLPVFLAIFLSVGACLAQNSVDAGLYYVYDYKLEPAMTPAPKGYKPFYISHYGRHGARYCEREFDSLAVWLEKAATAGVLTEKGIHFHTLYKPFYEKARYCKGALTELGKDQHRTIAGHMFNRFPEVFEGQTKVRAFSTEVPRVVASMNEFLCALREADSSMETEAGSSTEYCPWLNPIDPSNPYLIKGRREFSEESGRKYDAFFEKTVPWKKIAAELFEGEDVLVEVIHANPEYFVKALHAVICDTYCLDEDRGLFDGILSEEELHAIWKSLSARNFQRFSEFTGSECLNKDYSAYMLENIIESALSDMASGDVQLRLRFSHDAGLLMLLPLMDLNGFGRGCSDFEDAVRVFPNYNIPMGSSLQFIFFRNPRGKILVKVLLNEKEASLPLREKGPYYKWKRFVKHYRPIISASKKKIEKERGITELWQRQAS